MKSVAISGGSDPTIFDLFEEIIGKNERFVIAQIEPISLAQLFIVHVKDNSQRTLLTVTTIPGHCTERIRLQNISMTIPSEFVIQIANTSNQILFTAKGFSLKEMTLWSGGDGKYLGKLKFASGICSSDLYVKGANKKLFFLMGTNSGGLCRGQPPGLSLTAKGVRLARIQSFNNGSSNLSSVDISLLNSRNTDTRTKVWVIFVGWQLYVTFFAKMTCGRTGVHKEKLFCICCQIMLLVTFVITVISVLLILDNKWKH